jgi:hypothetical protein
MMNELMKAGFIKVGNVKININDMPAEAWTYLVGGDDNAPDLRKYFRSIAWLNRGIHLRKQAVASMPFTIKKGENIIDQSNDYQNVLGFLPNPRSLFGICEQSLSMTGREYIFINRRAIMGRAVPSGLQHMTSSSIRPVYDENNGELLYFERTMNGKIMEPLDVEDVLYFWPTDDAVENGPPQDWPALAALQAAGVLYSVDGFATMFFDRGAIKVTLIATKGNVVEAERDRLKSWWRRILGKAWSSEIVNADGIEIHPVGEGLESLTDTNLTTEKREDISTALGVPHSMLFSNAANYATSVQDKQNWYEDMVIPDCLFEFEPQALSIFQEDEEERGAAFLNYVNAGIRPSIPAAMLGLEMPVGIEYTHLDERYDGRLEAADNLAMLQPGKEDDKEDDKEDEFPPGKTLHQVYLEKWQKKCLHRIRKGQQPACDFDTEHIPLVVQGAISGALESVSTVEDVKAVFDDVWIGYP